jgi:hypothetical protein
MPSALEVIGGQATAPGATLTAAAPFSGQSFTVRNAPLTARPLLVALWAYTSAAGQVRVRSPRLHDNVNGIRVGVPTNLALPIIPDCYQQLLYPQDTLDVAIAGSSTASDIEQVALLVYYPDLPGAQARFAAPAEVKSRGKNLKSIYASITAGTTGGWSGTTSLDAIAGAELKANTDYAIVGYHTTVRGLAVAISGVETGNLRVGGPLEPSIANETPEWFVYLSERVGVPMVPVINSANAKGINVEVSTDQAGGTFGLTLHLVEM